MLSELFELQISPGDEAATALSCALRRGACSLSGELRERSAALIQILDGIPVTWAVELSLESLRRLEDAD